MHLTPSKSEPLWQQFSCVQQIFIGCALGLTLVALQVMARAESTTMPSAAPNLIEAGAPLFTVLGREALGFSTPPTGLHLLPDGRILVVSQHEIALGDGVRWETYLQAPNSNDFIYAEVAVDKDGEIYGGVPGAVARIEFGEDGHWKYVPVVQVPVDSPFSQVDALRDTWFWYGGGRTVLAWRPGEKPTPTLLADVVDRVFSLDSAVYASSSSSGSLYRLLPGEAPTLVSSSENLLSESIICSADYKPHELLIGTLGAGIRTFDGQTSHDIPLPAILGRGNRINDLCQIGTDFYAAAVDTKGIVFFDHSGRIVQVVDRKFDNRLARVKRIRYSPTGVLWALLDNAVACVQFPSPISHFEPVVASAMNYARPVRHDGLLWMLTDGRLTRATYDADGRLEGFENDTPKGNLMWAVADVGGALLATNDTGIYKRTESGWTLIAAGIVNARPMANSQKTDGSFFYVARGEMGWIRRTASGYSAERFPVQGLGEIYNAVEDANGTIWLELGVARVGRVDFPGGRPDIRFFGLEDGLIDGWANLYTLDGIVRCQLAGHTLLFNPSTGRFAEDKELLARVPAMANSSGRPIRDASGRLWFAAMGNPHVVDDRRAERAVATTIPLGFEPTEFDMETNGVVWMENRDHMARFDPRLPDPPTVPLRAQLTSIQLTASNRRLFAPGSALPALSYADNSLVMRFAAPATPFGVPLSFEFMLEGASNQWTAAGATGSAAFNHLKEGAYVFRVRPRAGETIGTEARLAFTILPPWYRTKLAWLTYIVGTVSVILLVAWLLSYLERRENQRLERLVLARTGELSASEERYRLLNADLEHRVQARTAELSQRNADLFQERLLLRTLIDNLPLAVYTKDRAGRKTLANPADLKNMRCASEAEALGKTDSDVFPEEQAAKFRADDQAVLQTGKPILGHEESFVDGEGRKHWLLTSKLPLRNQKGEIIGLVGIGPEITSLKESEQQREMLHRQLIAASRTAGMAEVATDVLHNVGNVLNSVNVAAGIVVERLRASRVDGVIKLARTLREQGANLARFLTEDERGKKVPAYLDQLAEHLAQERADVDAELKGLTLNVEHIKEIVAMQQNYARVSGVIEEVNLSEMVEDAFRFHSSSYTRHGVTLEREYDSQLTLSLDKHSLLQIVVNLFDNAKHACEAANGLEKKVIVRAKTAGPERVKIEVSDNGIGIAAENLTRVFSHGFTTRKEGHGFGLHSGALAAKQMGGSLTVVSAGVGLGATFILELPLKPARSSQRADSAF